MVQRLRRSAFRFYDKKVLLPSRLTVKRDPSAGEEVDLLPGRVVPLSGGHVNLGTGPACFAILLGRRRPFVILTAA